MKSGDQKGCVHSGGDGGICSLCPAHAAAHARWLVAPPSSEPARAVRASSRPMTLTPTLLPPPLPLSRALVRTLGPPGRPGRPLGRKSHHRGLGAGPDAATGPRREDADIFERPLFCPPQTDRRFERVSAGSWGSFESV